MGYDIELYSVTLSTFFNALHSGNDEIVEEALAYIKREIIYKYPRKPNEAARTALEEKLFASNLEQLISKEDKADSSKKRMQAKVEEDSLAKKLQPYIMNCSVLGILSLSPNFGERGIINVSHFSTVFYDLEASASVSTDTIELWESLMNGRLLAGEADAYTNHTYLFNKELKDTLNILKFYDTELGKQHLAQVFERQQTNPQPKNELTFWQTDEGQEFMRFFERHKQELAVGNLQFPDNVEWQRLKALRDKYYRNCLLNRTTFYALTSDIESITYLFDALVEEGADLFGILG